MNNSWVSTEKNYATVRWNLCFTIRFLEGRLNLKEITTFPSETIKRPLEPFLMHPIRKQDIL